MDAGSTSSPHQHSLSPAIDRTARVWSAGTGLAALSGCALLALVDPSETRLAPSCPWLVLTGRWCPGCGGLRALRALLTGDVPAALGWNPLAVVALPLVALLWALWAVRSWTPWRPPLPALSRLSPAAWSALGLAVAAFWILRNVAAHPFALLAP